MHNTNDYREVFLVMLIYYYYVYMELYAHGDIM